MHRSCLSLLLLVMACPTVWPQAGDATAGQVNLVENGGFDALGNEDPRGWRRSTWGGEPVFSVDPIGGRGGGPCVKIESRGGADASWSYPLEVTPHTRYRLSVWIRTRKLDPGSGLGAGANLHELQMDGKTAALSGDRDWTRVSSEFDSGAHRSLLLNVLFGGWGHSTGEAWYDDVEVIDLSAPLPVLDEAGKVAFFERDVQPILRAHCAECHIDTDKPKAGLYLGSRRGLLHGGDRGPAVQLDDPQSSVLLAAVGYATLQMPPAGKLAAAEIATLTTWVRLGAPWTPATADFLPASLNKGGGVAVDDATRAHWSFQPIRRPALPAPRAAHWVKQPLDAFVLDGIERRGLTPAGPARRAALLRRATYDITGLPPTRAELDAFLADHDAGAWERVVDRLLASPRYGEKWGRHWLDVVRYAETNSFERDGVKPHVWRYRDYVIQSLNADKPFDRFVLEQLAGDELPDANPQSIIATGFYRLMQWDDEPADPDQAEFDELDDIVATTGQALLGLTLNCARCHDHKLDPIPQRDYYRMVAWFRNVRHYGVRTHDSVVDASVREIASAEARAGQRAAIEAHDRDLAEVEVRLAEIEEVVRADFAPVEHEEFQSEASRVALIERRGGTLLTEAVVAEYRALTQRRTDLRRFNAPELARALCVKEQGTRSKRTFVLIRGSPHAPGEEVEPGLPEVLGQAAPPIEPPAAGESTGRRLALARWIVDPRNPLTARVIVNRLWQHHFGRGIVRTPNDFGLKGAVPTHPELLDWLAAELIDNGWSLKRLHRQILCSNSYQMGSMPTPAALQADPDNDLFTRYDMRRLTAEEIRDSLLAVNGTLNDRMFGPGVYPTIPAEVLAGQSRPGDGWGRSSAAQQARRSIYIHVKRSLIVPILASFDYADTDFTCPERFVTTQPTQALSLMNSDFLVQQAALLADDLRAQADDPRAQVEEALFRVFQRAPTAGEIDRGLALMTGLAEEPDVAPERVLQCFCLTALNLNEFLYLD